MPPASARPPQALQSLSLTAPFPVVERFVRGLGRFTGLRQLELRAEMGTEEDEEGDVVECWSVGSVLRLALLRHLPPQLQSLTLANCYCVHLEAAGTAAEPASSASPAQLLPAVTQLHISGARAVLLDLPLPSLADLTISDCELVSLEGERTLCLPQLTSLQLHNASRRASLRCNAMPALARLSCSGHLRASDSFSALRRLTHLHLSIYEGRRTGEQLVAGVAPFLHSMTVQLPPRSEWLAEQAAQALATAGASQLTRLVGWAAELPTLLPANVVLHALMRRQQYWYCLACRLHVRTQDPAAGRGVDGLHTMLASLSAARKPAADTQNRNAAFAGVQQHRLPGLPACLAPAARAAARPRVSNQHHR